MALYGQPTLQTQTGLDEHMMTGGGLVTAVITVAELVVTAFTVTVFGIRVASRNGAANRCNQSHGLIGAWGNRSKRDCWTMQKSPASP